MTELLREAARPKRIVLFGSQTRGEARPDSERKKPCFIDGCKAWAADGPVVQRLFPLHYRAMPKARTG